MTLALMFFLAYIFLGILLTRKYVQWKGYDAITLLPWLSCLASDNPCLPLLAFQVQAILCMMALARKADKPQTEALVKFAASLLIGTTLLGAAYCLLQSPQSPMLWPLNRWLDQQGSWYEALGATLSLLGIIVLIGLPPLQHGWPDLAESFGASEQLRFHFILRSGLCFSLFSLLSFFEQAFSESLLSFMAIVGVLGLVLARLVVGVQMSVFRAFAYQGNFAFLAFFVALATPQNWKGSYDIDLIALIFASLSLLACLLQSRPFLLVKGPASLHWDDAALSSSSRRDFHMLLACDLVLAIIAGVFLGGTRQYSLAAVTSFYALCVYSLLQDKDAFRPRAR